MTTIDWYPFSTFPPAAFELAGAAGVVLYVTAYALISLNRIDAGGFVYFGLNLVAATFVLASLAVAFNLAVLLIQLFWIAMSLGAIVLRLRGRAAPEPARAD